MKLNKVLIVHAYFVEEMSPAFLSDVHETKRKLKHFHKELKNIINSCLCSLSLAVLSLSRVIQINALSVSLRNSRFESDKVLRVVVKIYDNEEDY